MSYLKKNRVGFVAAAVVVFAIAAVEGCSSSGDDQSAPSAGTGGQTTGGTSGGTGTAGSAGKGGTSSGGSAGSGTTAGTGGTGGGEVGEGGAAGETGVVTGPVCEPAEDHGEAAVIANNGGHLPALP
jgi:hypothetical protein